MTAGNIAFASEIVPPFPASLGWVERRLFTDMGEANPGALGVKKTKIADAFPAVGHALLFLFDYGDEWRFRVKLKATGSRLAKTRYPRIVASGGEAPEQYPDPDETGQDGPRYGISLATGEIIKVG